MALSDIDLPTKRAQVWPHNGTLLSVQPFKERARPSPPWIGTITQKSVFYSNSSKFGDYNKTFLRVINRHLNQFHRPGWNSIRLEKVDNFFVFFCYRCGFFCLFFAGFLGGSGVIFLYFLLKWLLFFFFSLLLRSQHYNHVFLFILNELLSNTTINSIHSSITWRDVHTSLTSCQFLIRNPRT